MAILKKGGCMICGAFGIFSSFTCVVDRMVSEKLNAWKLGRTLTSICNVGVSIVESNGVDLDEDRCGMEWKI